MAKKEKKTEELTATERAKMLGTEIASYPCFDCRRNQQICDYTKCWMYRVWFALKWREVTGILKRKR